MSKDYFGRASQLLGWASDAIGDMTTAGSRGDINSVERHFYSLLAHIFTLHEVLRARAGKGAWRDALTNMRDQDPLLRYFWLARNSEHHDALLKWGKEAIEFNVRVIDANKCRRAIIGYRVADPWMSQADQMLLLTRYLFNVQSIDAMRGGNMQPPTPERLASAGVELDGFANTITLKEFDARDHGRIQEPTSHLGKPIAPVAIVCSKAALQFYASKLDELK